MRPTNIATTVVTMIAITAIAGCSGNKSDTVTTDQPQAGNQTLTMYTSADYPPYEYHDTTSGQDKIIGFDVDIANYIAKQLKFDVKVKDTDFNGLIPSLQAKRADFVMAGMTPNPERKKNVDFTQVYYEAKNTLVAEKGKNYSKIEDLAGKKVGVQLGTIQEKLAKKAAEKTKGLNIVELNKIGDVIQEIKANRIDAAVIEDTVAKGYVASNSDLELKVIPNTEAAGSAIAFPKGSKYVADFDKALSQMKQDGELDKLAKKWFQTSVKSKT